MESVLNIKKIQEEVNNPQISVSSLLRKVKVVASDLKQKDFVEWIDKEIDGYDKKDKVPEYRIIKGIPRGYNPFRGWIPYVHTDSEIQDSISTRGVGQSIGELEEMLKNEKGSLAIKYPPDFEEKLRKGVKADVDIALFIDRSAVAGILERVRNIILDWTLKLKEAGVSDSSSTFSSDDIDEASGVKFKYNIKHIENFTGNIGESNSFESISGQLVPQETFWNKFFWYVLVALAVVVVGNILSAVILKYVFKII